MEKKTIVIEVKGGLVIDVRNLPDGWNYDLIDWDVCSECGDSEPYFGKCKERQEERWNTHTSH